MDNFKFKVETVKELEHYLVVLEKKCQEELKLLRVEGINRNYSINSDIFKIATEIYKLSVVLGYLATFNLQFLNKEKK